MFPAEVREAGHCDPYGEPLGEADVIHQHDDVAREDRVSVRGGGGGSTWR